MMALLAMEELQVSAHRLVGHVKTCSPLVASMVASMEDVVRENWLVVDVVFLDGKSEYLILLFSSRMKY